MAGYGPDAEGDDSDTIRISGEGKQRAGAGRSVHLREFAVVAPQGTVDIIIPVYNQLQVVQPCVESVVRSISHNDIEVVVIDDASTDPDVKAYLSAKAQSGQITLYVNEINLGFTRTVNRGMSLRTDRDVILLNSDTLVFESWAERLREAAYSDPLVATANPLTSSSHISNYPHRKGPNSAPLETPYDVLDNLARERNAGLYSYVHTTVGFCMYIKRACIDQIGIFDATHFPVGYGEESDFCYRARKLGWRHLVAGNVFVPHLEGQSFGEKKRALMEKMISKFSALHPELAYFDDRFRRLDPVFPLRAGLDLARMKRLLGGRSCVMLRISPDDLEQAPNETVTLDFDPVAGMVGFVVHGDKTFPNLERYRVPLDILRLNEALTFLGIERIVCPSSQGLAEFGRRLTAVGPEVGLACKLVVGVPASRQA